MPGRETRSFLAVGDRALADVDGAGPSASEGLVQGDVVGRDIGPRLDGVFFGRLQRALGIQDVVAKSIGSSNPYNMVKAALEAFKLMESPRMVAGRRGRRVNEVLGRKGDEKEKSDD